MDGVTDAAMRAYLGSWGVFSYAVSEFARVSVEPLPAKVFRRDIPEICNNGKTTTGMPVQVQILGSDLDNMAKSARTAVDCGATGIDINFGCPAPVVNRHDGGASLLRCPPRVRDVVHAVRQAVPNEIPVSAKLRLGWDDIDAIFENAEMAVAGGASWITIHARTKVQGYQPPVYWPHIGEVRKRVGVPVVANGDIWNLDDFRRCRDESGCQNFMIGRGALANPHLAHQIAKELGLPYSSSSSKVEWDKAMTSFVRFSDEVGMPRDVILMRLKQWSKIAKLYGDFSAFDEVKHATTIEEFFVNLTPKAKRPMALIAFQSELQSVQSCR